MVFSDEDKTAFLTALKNGLGLTSACDLLLMNPKEVSAYIRKHKDFHKECVEALKFSAKALLVISNSYLNDGAYDKWKTNNTHIREFIVDLVLWESYKHRKEITPEDITIAASMYRNMGEVATACGFLKKDLLAYIVAHPALNMYFVHNSLG